MEHLSHDDLIRMFLALGVLLATARILGETATRLGQPSVVGELAAGVLLGPTVLGAVFPGSEDLLFPKSGARYIFLEGFTTISVALFLFVAGMEVDLSTIWRQGQRAAIVSILGIAAPFAVGFVLAWYGPGLLLEEPTPFPLPFALFIGAALSISALPMIIKTLMDLKLYRSDFGMLVTAAATFNDLIGWMIFSIVLGMISESSGQGTGSLAGTIFSTMAFAIGILTVGRWAVHQCLPWIQAHTAWPGGVLSLSLALALFAGAAAEAIGVHAIFGTFLIGVAIGDSPHLREHTRTVLEQFIAFIFAPIFFASIGLRVNFVASFDLILVVLVFVVASAGKILGCSAAGLMTGMPKRESWALGCAMNSRGVMEIILGLVALNAGLIDQTLFVALVVMALGTSMLSGPLIERVLNRKKSRHFFDFFSAKAFTPELKGQTPRDVIEELTTALAETAGLDPKRTIEAVLDREATMPTGLENRIAIPHAHIKGLKAPAVACGISHGGCDFDAPDGKTAQLIFLILTPDDDSGAMLELLADIAETFQQESSRVRALKARNATEFLALLKSGGE
jgi:Kef-type K+ transport system membrane component KefB/mannitol/fructose-specific phosphotransferase system IIA component (Ntr-type)